MAEKGEIKLIGSPASIYVNRVQYALNLKHIDYEFIPVNLVCKSDLLLKSNPVHKKVPVLLHGNKPPICESLIIIEYLDEIRPDAPRILPSVPLERAESRFWADYMDKKFFPFFPLFEKIRLTPGKDGKAAVKKLIAERVGVLEEAFLKCSNGKAYFAGDEIGYLDLVLGCYLGWMKYFETVENYKVLDETNSPGLVGWAEQMRSHEAIKDVIPGVDTLMEFYMMLQVAKPPK